MGQELQGGNVMRDDTNAPTVPQVTTTTHEPVVRADGGQRTRSYEAHEADAPLVPDLS